MGNTVLSGAKGVIIFNSKAKMNTLINMVNSAAKTTSIFIGYNNGAFLVNSTDKKTIDFTVVS